MSNLWERVYQSNNILTTVSMINDNLYIGEINFETKQNYLTVNEKIMPVETPVSLIYQMEKSQYFASFKNELNNNVESYYLIQNAPVNKKSDKEIIFFGTKD